jgi:hypothetical protein
MPGSNCTGELSVRAKAEVPQRVQRLINRKSGLPGFSY